MSVSKFVVTLDPVEVLSIIFSCMKTKMSSVTTFSSSDKVVFSSQEGARADILTSVDGPTLIRALIEKAKEHLGGVVQVLSSSIKFIEDENKRILAEVSFLWQRN